MQQPTLHEFRKLIACGWFIPWMNALIPLCCCKKRLNHPKPVGRKDRVAEAAAAAAAAETLAVARRHFDGRSWRTAGGERRTWNRNRLWENMRAGGPLGPCPLLFRSRSCDFSFLVLFFSIFSARKRCLGHRFPKGAVDMRRSFQLRATRQVCEAVFSTFCLDFFG